MKQYLLLILAIVLLFNVGSGQILCIYCYDQNDSISNNVTNLIQNGSFENTTCNPAGNNTFCPNSFNYNCNLTNWTCVGGGTSTYAQLFPAAYSAIPDGLYAAYFGNSFCNICSSTQGDLGCLTNTNCQITGVPPGYPINLVDYGGTNGLSLQQTVTGLTVGNTYVLEFWTGGEDFGAFIDPGIFGLDIGFGYDLLETVPTDAGDIGKTYIVIFNATSTSHTIKFTNWGHVCPSCSELTLDLVRLYTVAQLDPSVNNCGGSAVFATTITPVQPLCYGQCNGTATANVSGGVAPLSYQWNTGSTAAAITGLCAGAYAVTVTDSTGATATASIVLANPGQMTTTIVSDPSICGGNTGRAISTVFGGTTPHTYSWTPSGQTTPTATNLPGGQQTLLVTDANGCTATANVTVGEGLPPTASWNLLSGGPCMNGAPYLFDATATNPNNTTYNWSFQNGVPATATWQDPQTVFSQPGSNLVTLITTSGNCRDTISQLITVLAVPVANAGPNVAFCEGTGGVNLQGSATIGAAPYAYLWACDNTNTPCALSSTTIDNPLANPTATTTYSLQVTDANGCVSNLDTTLVTVEPDPTVDLGADSALCLGSTLTLDAANVGSTYLWSDGSAGQTLLVSTTGTYTVTVTSLTGCSNSDAVTITQAPNYRFSLGADSTFCGLTPFKLSIGIPARSVLWSDGSSESSLTVSRDGTYWAEVITQCDILRDSIKLSFIDGNYGPYLPNSFTPNGDDLNDVFQIGGDLVGAFKIQIFDRWGKLIFASEDIKVSWDGKIAGVEAPEGVYAFVIHATDCFGVDAAISGSVQLMR
jgi:gliding motility-associated-like protein